MAADKFYIIGDDGICTFINRCLSRYHVINDNLIASLMGSYLWFSNPLEFNDPYDCNLDFDFENTPEELEFFFREINNSPQNAHLKFNEEQFQFHLTNCIKNPEILRSRNREQRINEVNKIGICCFSENDDKLLMWSHYADKHQGVCLTFDIDEDNSIFLIPYSVEYRATYPQVNFIRERGYLKPKRFLIATKSLEWSYEAEVRVVRDDTRPPYRGAVNFNKRALVAVKFGYRSSTDEQLRVRKALTQAGGYEHVRFYLAKLKHLGFGIEYEEIF